jgi:uncharacterized membrane protein
MTTARHARAGHAENASVQEEINIRHIDVHDLRAVLSQGWDDFLAKRGDLLFIGLIYPAAVLLMILYALNASILPLIFPLAAGSILFGPVAASGFYELARRREQGLDSRWQHFLDVLRSNAAPSLLVLTAIIAVIFAAWIAVAWIIYADTLGADSIWSVTTFLQAVFTTSEGRTMIVIGNLVGLGFAVLTLAATVISFPMLVDRPVGWRLAIRTSLRVAYHNPVTIAVWGLIVVGLLVLGAIPAFIGLAVVLPVLGYATWHLYTRAVVR